MSESPADTVDSDADDTPDNLPAETADIAPEPGLDPDWQHERIDFAGDLLAVRAPTSQALAGFSLASSKYVSTEVKNDMTGLFIVEHIAPESYGRVMQRLMDADDPDYDSDTLGQLMREIVMLTTNAVTTEE